MKKKLALMLVLLVLLGTFAGCAGKGEKDGEITLTWYANISKEPGSEEVFKMVSDIAKEKIGVAVDIIPLEDYDGKMPVIQASGEDYDIVFTSSAVNNIYKNVANENLLAIDELLEKEAPALKALFSDEVWDGVRINGKIYGVPNQQIFARGPGYLIPTQNLELLGIDLSTNPYQKLEDYESYFRAIKEKTGKYGYLAHTWSGDGAQAYGFEQVVGSGVPGAVRYKEGKLKVVDQYESQEYIDHMNLRYRWVQEGLTAPMEVSLADLSKYAAPEDEIMPWLVFLNTCSPGAEGIYKRNYGTDFTFGTKTEPLLSSYGLTATMVAINADTRYPVESIKFIELLNTDKEIYRLLTYGIEGKNYTKTGENSIQPSKENPYSQNAWAIGNTFNGFVLPTQEPDVFEQTKALNDSAVRSPILGFAVDQEPVKVQIANCRAIAQEYVGLELGLMDPEIYYPQFIKKLKAAGVDELIAELDKQLQVWLKENK